jgi:hypothetical protein
LDGGMDVPIMNGGMDVVPLDGGMDVPIMNGGMDVVPLDGGMDVVPLDGGMDVVLGLVVINPSFTLFNTKHIKNTKTKNTKNNIMLLFILPMFVFIYNLFYIIIYYFN